MKNIKVINFLVACIVVFSTIACLFGLFSTGGKGEYEFTTINNEIVKISGSGIYKNDSISAVAQGKASDFITIILGIPLLLTSLYYTNKRTFIGKLLLTGTLGYFLYTYMSYTFLWMYNRFFIVYVMLMSLSLFAFILSMMSFDMKKIKIHYSEKLPVKFLGGFQIFVAISIGLLWLGKLAPSVISSSIPSGLEHYTTLVIQGMDLGIVVPAAMISGILLIKRKPFGYLLSSVIIIKGITMLTAISAMIISQAISGVKVGIAEVIIFPIFTLITIIALVILIKNIRRNVKAI